MSQTTSQRVPPLESSGVFALSVSVTINSAAANVWRVLTDFQSYPEWNPFTRTHYVVDQTGARVPDDQIAEGMFLDIPDVHVPPTMGEPIGRGGRISSFELVTVFDRTNYRLAWELSRPIPGWLLRAERWQVLTDQGNGQTKYYTIEVFGGLLAYPVRWFQRDDLALGFQAMADGLKERSEQV